MVVMRNVEDRETYSPEDSSEPQNSLSRVAPYAERNIMD